MVNQERNVMKNLLSLENLDNLFPKEYAPDQIAKAKTIFLKELSYLAHKFYRGKMVTVPKSGMYGFNWFNVWYTPGVSKISTSIRDDNETSFALTNRGNFVAVVSDSTRVLGDGDCTPPGGLGVMEGKAFLMKYLGSIDAVALCIDSRNAKGQHDPDKIIDFVKMLEPSFGAVNLEDISQPNCFKVLDTLREECDIPVWHDDAQGTGCVTLAGLINALKVAGKRIDDISIVFIGAGAANTSIARLIMTDGADPSRIVMFDSRGALHKNRKDIQEKTAFYRKWEICKSTNPKCIETIEDAVKGADVLIAVSTPGPGKIKPEWIQSMAEKPIVFAAANPVPEIYPHTAKEAGAFIVATGRGDFPNQVNNSLGFPGILKGSLMVHARKVTDTMAISAAHGIADFAEKYGKKDIGPNYIIPTMDEVDVYPYEAAEVAVQAVKDGVSRVNLSFQEVFDKAKSDITFTRKLIHHLMDEEFIAKPPQQIIDEALRLTIQQIG